MAKRRKKAAGMPKEFKIKASSKSAACENIKERKPLIPCTSKTSSEQSKSIPKTEQKKEPRMAKNKKGRSKSMAGEGKATPTADNQGITQYHMELSRQRLRQVGFHPSVTSKTAEEVEHDWLWRIDRLIDRPTREQFMGQVESSLNEFCIPSKKLTTAMILLRHECACDLAAKDLDNKDDNALATIFNTVDIGGEVAKHVFAQGWKSVFNTAITSSSVWRAISNTATIWDFYAADLRADGKSGVLLAVTPECTIGELNEAHDLDPYSLDPTNVLSSWVKEAMKCEREIFLSVRLIHDRIMGKTGRGKGNKRNPEARKILPVEFMADKIVSAVKNIGQLKGLWGSSQFISSPHGRLFEPSAMFAAKRLRMMLNHISTQRTALKVLYFQQVPLLDRRMVAVILRACTNVRMIAIYDCPLIHFGDVLSLVDLIYEVNHTRRQAGLAEIEGFDFYPRYNYGTPFKTETSGTYGLTWGPHNLGVVQRGFFNIVLKAFMKAKRMKLGLLFDKDKSFCAYLHQVPLPALAVPMFLDGLYRYMEVRDQDSKRKALYDLLKPVRLGVVFHMDRDWPKFYANAMGKNLMFCSSCGYEVLEEFFAGAARAMQPHRRVCAGCTLQRWLDDEDDHLKEYKKQALDTFYPDWKGLEFNTDAPLPQIATDIIKLRSTTSVRSDHNSVIVNSDGVMHGREVVPDLVRDNKIQLDSLQNLPGLTELLSRGRTWGSFYNKCNNLDVYSRAVHRIHEENDHERIKKPFLRSRFDGGMPDTADELQPPRNLVPGLPSHDISSAFIFHLGLTKKGWGASGPNTEPRLEPQLDLPVFNEGFW